MRRAGPSFVAALLAAVSLVIAGCGGSAHHSAAAAAHDCHAVYGPTVHRLAIKQGIACPPKTNRPTAVPPSNVPGTTVEQFDSTEVGTVPASAFYVAGYVNGSWPTYWQMKGRWPVVVGIAVSTSAGADCIDLEPGNPPPWAARPWVTWQFTQGNTQPCVYSMLSWMGQIRANLSGIPQCSSASQTRCVRLWDANWTYFAHVDAGYSCTQWTDHAYNRNLDESTCLRAFYPAPPPKPVEKCLRKPYPQSRSCGMVRYGYSRLQGDIAKVQSRLRQHHCSARVHPSYCRGWQVALGRDARHLADFKPYE